MEGSVDENDIRRWTRLLSAAFLLFVSVFLPVTIIVASEIFHGVYFFLGVGAAGIVAIAIFDSLFMTALRRFVAKVRQYRWFYLDDAQLEIGDIIASRNTGKGSRLIREVTGGAYSHVALYLGDGRIIEAVPPRVRVTRTPFHMMADARDIKVFRSPKPIPKVKEMRAEAYRYSFNLYSFAKAASFAFPSVSILAAPDANICSELVVLLYRAGGLDIFHNLQQPSPGDICRSKKIRDVSGIAVLPVPDNEIPNALWEVAYYTLSLIQFIKRIGAWLFATIYRVSPLRLALGTSEKSWGFSEKFAFYGFATGFAIEQIFTVLKCCLFFVVLWLRRPTYSAGAVERARNRIARSKRVALSLLARDNRGITEGENDPPPWPRVYSLLLRVGRRLRLIELWVLSRSEYLVGK